MVTQGILELYQKYVAEDADEDEDHHNGLDKVNQQAYIFANHARAMKKNGISDKTIFTTLQSELPAYLKKHKAGKLLAIEIMKNFVTASTFSKIELPDLTPPIEKILKEKGVDKYFKALTKRRPVQR